MRPLHYAGRTLCDLLAIGERVASESRSVRHLRAIRLRRDWHRWIRSQANCKDLTSCIILAIGLRFNRKQIA